MKQELQFVTAVKKEFQSIDFDDVRRKESQDENKETKKRNFLNW